MPENSVIVRIFSMNMVGKLFSMVATLVSKLTLGVSEMLAIILFYMWMYLTFRSGCLRKIDA